MNPEIATVLANIGSLVEEAKSMMNSEGASKAGEGMPDEEEKLEPELAQKILKYLKEMEGTEEGEEDEKKEEEIGKSDEGTHGDDKAAEIIDEVGDVNEKNIAEVAKAIVKGLMAKKNVVAKSKDNVQKSLEPITRQISVLNDAVSALIEGFGIAEQVKLANSKVEKSEDSRPKNDPNEIKKTIDMLREALGGDKVSTASPDATDLRKSLTANGGEALMAIFGKNAR